MSVGTLWRERVGFSLSIESGLVNLRDQLAGRPSPILVLGMHRSGTSVVSRLIQSAGVNMGARQDDNAESRFFVRMNRWLLSQCGATWANVDSVPTRVAAHVGTLAPTIERRTRSVWALEHFGNSSRQAAWGFKDPTSCLLFHIYEQVLPDCKVVLVSRHGVDVAESLRIRAHASFDAVGTGSLAPVLGVRQPRSNRLQNAIVASDLQANFALWMSYQRAIEAIGSRLDPSRVFGIRFEDLIARPDAELAAMSEFLGSRIPGSQLRPARRFAYRESSELVSFAHAHRAELGLFGY